MNSLQRTLRLLLLGALTLASALASAEFIAARRVETEPPADPVDAAWAKLPPVPVRLFAQVSVAPAMKPAGVSTVNVRALYTADTLALHMEWQDPKPVQSRALGEFADGAAVQWPVHHVPGQSLPYVGMGHAGMPVALWFWRADGSVETLAAEGFGTLTMQPTDGLNAKGVWKDGLWRVVFKRSLRAAPGDDRVQLDPPAQGLVPVAFAVWNGEGKQRNGMKRLSGWHALRFETAAVDEAYAKLLRDDSVSGGNAGAGRRLMAEKGCAGCHAYPGNPARPSIGPDLTYAGAIHPVRYLLESLSEPSQVIVPGKNYARMQDGKRVSMMPPFVGSEQELRDIVAFVKTLR